MHESGAAVEMPRIELGSEEFERMRLQVYSVYLDLALGNPG